MSRGVEEGNTFIPSRIKTVLDSYELMGQLSASTTDTQI